MPTPHLSSLSLSPWQQPPNRPPCFCSWLPSPFSQHSLSFQLKLKIKSCHSTAYKYIVMSSNQLGPCPPHPTLPGPNHPTPTPAILAFSQVPGHGRKLSPQGLCTCSCQGAGPGNLYLMPSQPSGLKNNPFKTSSWAKSFVVVKYIQPKIDHFSHL